MWLCACVETGLNDPDESAVPPVVVEEAFQQVPYAGVDVLFVLDSTGSMAEEQAVLGAAAGAFVDALEGLGLDWQIGVTTMDLADVGALRGRPWILTPVTESAAAALAANVDVGTASAPPAAGFDAVVLALDNEANLGFRRPDAALHVVFVSDGDDQSGAVLKGDVVEGMLGVLAEQEVRSGRPARASAIVDDGAGACEEGAFDATPGPAFVEVAERAGGVVTNICTGDFSPVAGALAAVGAVGATVFPLQGTPAADTVTVTVDGTRLGDGWTIDAAGPSLVFSAPPALGATVVVRYELAS